MSTNQPGEQGRPNQRTDADLAIDPSTSPAVLASLAEDRAAVRHFVAANPSAPVHILMWLHELRDPAIERALSSNPTATSANVVRMTMAPPLPAPSPEAIVPTTATGPAAATALGPNTPPGPTGVADPTQRIEPVVVGAASAMPLAGTAAAGAGAGAGATMTHEHPGRGWASWAILLVPLLAIAGVAALVALVNSSGNNDRRPVTAAASTTLATLAPSAAPSTQPTLAPSTAAAVTAPPATDAPTTQAPDSSASPASEAPATTAARPVTTARRPTTTVRPATTVAPTTPTTARATASVASTTAAPPPTVLAATVVPTTSATPTTVSAAAVTAATGLAQRLAAALASSDWATARKINPAGALSDAKYGADYGNLTDSTVVPVVTTATGKSTYSMRLGLVAHETTPAGVRSTTLFCVHWNADTAASTIVQVDGSKVRTASGRVEASAVTSELKKACAAANLK